MIDFDGEEERIEFAGGYIQHHYDPATTEVALNTGPWTSSEVFIKEDERRVLGGGHWRLKRTVGLRMDDTVWNAFTKAVSDNDPEVRALRCKVQDLTKQRASAEHERDNYKRAYELKPATMRLDGPGAEALAARIDDIDDLRATIVSQAREIARLKGEGS
ncbi:hypothetical protein [Streptomyces niveus]|uniref:hypothetical protein n=1 Tax=Streptomyces niveus TaxID=193462 RepID=UPI0036581B99